MIKVHIHCYNDYHDCETCGSDFNTLYTITGDLGDWEMGGYAACFGQPSSNSLEVITSILFKVEPDIKFNHEDYIINGKGGYDVVEAKFKDEPVEGGITVEFIQAYLLREHGVEITWESEESQEWDDEDDDWDD